MAAFGEVIYATPGYPPDPDADPEWAIRVANHKAGRPASWRTVETTDLVGVLADADAPVLVDCLGTWMTRVLDTLDAWELPAGEAAALAEREIAELAAGLAACEQPVTVVTNEVGWGWFPVRVRPPFLGSPGSDQPGGGGGVRRGARGRVREGARPHRQHPTR